jgi:NTP pyrophosphatase (non-canonical NTP hydrolase)
MTLGEYQEWTHETAVYTETVKPERRLDYALIGLLSEVGELAGIIKREIRGDGRVDPKQLQDELGDVLWYIARVANESGLSLQYALDRNVAKLMDRKARGVIRGKGGNR